MKFKTVFFVVLAACALAPTANAQGGPFNIGGMVGLDQKRLEIAPAVQFAMAAYTAKPPRQGFDSPELSGFFSSALGMYPTLMQGMWTKVVVNPNGINKLEGIDFDPTGNRRIDDKQGWEELASEPNGGYSIAVYCDEPRPISMRFRLRHRDGRDRYSFLFISATWTRGGNLPAVLEMIVQRRPPEAFGAAGEAAFPWLNGFIPATAQRKDQQNQPQSITVPGQTVSKTAKPEQTTSGESGGMFPTIEPPKSTPATIAPFGVMISAAHTDTLITSDKIARETKADFGDVPESPQKTSKNTETKIGINPMRASVLFRMESDRYFNVEYVRKDGPAVKGVPFQRSGKWVCIIWGKPTSFIDEGDFLVVRQDDQSRRLRFFEKTRDGERQ